MNKFIYALLCLFLNTGVISAQTDYYYYKGKRIPLEINDNKVCISIPKDNIRTSKSVFKNVKVTNIITDKRLDIIIITQSDFEKLTSLDSWEEDSKSVILTSCYFTKSNKEVFATPYLNVRLKKEEDIDILTSYAKEYGLNIVKQDTLMPLWYVLALKLDSKTNSVECANKLFESGKFAASVPDLCCDNMTCSNNLTYPNDPMFNQQWGLFNSNYPDIDISAIPAWDYSTGKRIKIAIIDQGVQLDHIDLASNISPLSYDTETNSSPSIVYDYHGTFCAGIAAAVKDNGVQIAGVAPDATIVSISNSLSLWTSNPLKLADGITWAYQHDVDIISNSWYSPIYHEAIDEAIQNAFRYGRQGKGSIIVFASGNDNDSICYPANCNDTILTVSAIFNSGSRYGLANYGSQLDLVAPGVYILSTIPDNGTMHDWGTSMACPHVAGVAALVLEQNSELTVNQVNSIICSNTKKIPGVNFNVTKPDGSWNIEYGYGLVDAYSSVINTPHVVYIQNDTITGTRVVSADSIYVGRNVTNTKAYGDVILGQGNITLKAKNVEIKNSTTVPLGTTLKIDK